MDIFKGVALCCGKALALTLALLCPALIFGAGPPLIRVDQPDYDFGTIYQGDKAEHVFTIKNIGQQNLEIKNVRSSCGCTVPTIAKMNLGPGETTELKAVFDSGRFNGSVTKNIFVYSNDLESPVTRLSIHMDVQVDLEVSPQSIYFAGLKEGDKVERSITIHNASKEPVTIKEIASTVSSVKLDLSKMKLEPGGRADLKLMIDKVSKDMKLSGTLTIINSSHQNQVTVQLYGGTIN
ncbi:MAG: hypothetical protein A3F83_09130 [Candidatus Glassbacteria bacterium RIFCSPLOWO2_12_FULL_58_11]|uniref:Abnormal spindle-like microcephaly-associated protein ASH domain-containing protein n=1 Tax=Candidatus Glassbacteria bacterium RIFCSPLOWO2_12_FULL_58_11 TaxID=1817867 RepID=A0A1F5YTI5_9BACT|nr:MAG: hypothetical protein A3F83_09130 [Candidatus Glassbacteria bacterium RIFCSPLOWO2_12_FULL_58_11]